MLRLKDITKDYKVADTKVRALKGINVSFRANEFVSILGPSGCGKTTLLNLVGGLDTYTSGDLKISGRSTKEFVDSDWDVYRNHRIGFIFQSYNLIPHQTVLGNVELALTIAGLPKAKRIEEAKKALDKVGLSDQYYKRPNQLSGGQSQRVAIARALVNNPDILLADEPTGALDTTTSVQIMELIKEISKEKLVIMVTHNPDLAEKYSTRIIKLLDGELVSDTNPFSIEDEKREVEKSLAAAKEFEAQELAKENIANPTKQSKKTVTKQKAKMSFWTAFRLSLQNLFTKKARTIMTSIAGSIGIIGVSLVLSISYGVQSFIYDMQNDMLSGNPIQIRESGVDISTLMKTTSRQDQSTALKDYIDGYISVDSMLEYLATRASAAESIMMRNNITQEYIDYVLTLPKEHAAAIYLDYGLDVTNNIYTGFYEKSTNAAKNISLSTIRTIYTSVLDKSPYADFASYITSLSDVFMQAPTNDDYILSQYNILNGKLAKEKDEVMIVVQDGSMMSDLLLAQLGYYTQDEFLNMIFKASPQSDGTPSPDYNPALDKERFSFQELMSKEFVWYPNNSLFNQTGSLTTPFTYNAYYKDTFTDGVPLKIVGILEPKEEIAYGCLESGFYYTDALRAHIIETNSNSTIVKTLKASGRDGIQSGEQGGAPYGITYNYSFTYTEGGVTQTYDNVVGYVGRASSYMSLAGSFLGNIPGLADLAKMKTLTMRQLGGIDLANGIWVYPVDFDTKDAVLAHLDKWNSTEALTYYSASQDKEITLLASERDDIKYTDNLSIIIVIVNNLISIVTFALIGFTSLSLVVSCVMIGIITYVSVVERIKEIGVIRSLGGRKRDVSYLFNAETFILGLVSGIIGISVTYLASWIINLIIYHTQDITAIAIFPWFYAVMMVGVSIALTLISGFLPARAAARKDPVVALRTE